MGVDKRQAIRGTRICRPIKSRRRHPFPTCAALSGFGWEEHLADVLDVPIEQVQGWHHPSTIPTDMDRKLYEIGHRRLEQIMARLR